MASLEKWNEAAAALRAVSNSGDAYGKLGKVNEVTGEYDWDVPGNPGYVYCRIEKEGTTEPGICIPFVALEPEVRVQFISANGVLVAVRPDFTDAVNLLGVLAPSLMVPMLPPSGRGGIGDLTPAINSVIAGDGQGWASTPLVTLLAALGFLQTGDAALVEIAAGEIETGGASVLVVESEGGTTDNLDTITLSAGNPRLLVIIAAAGHTLTLQNGVDNLFFNGGANLVLDDGQALLLYHDGTTAQDVSLGSGGTAASTSYDNSGSGLAAANVQDAIDELAAGGGGSGKTRVVGTVLWSVASGASGTPSTASADDNGNTGIPAGYDYLTVVLKKARSTDTGLDVVRVIFGTGGGAVDTTMTNYRHQIHGADNGGANNTVGDSPTLGTLPGSSTNLADNYALVELLIHNYEDATHKQVLSRMSMRYGASNQVYDSAAVWWENTGSITDLAFITDNHPTHVMAAGWSMEVVGWKEEVIGGIETSDAAVSSPPTDAELDAEFGTPASVGNGFTALLDDSGADSAVYLVASNGTSWWYTALTKAT